GYNMSLDMCRIKRRQTMKCLSSGIPRFQPWEDVNEGVYSVATGTKDKELFLIPHAYHIETYWKPEYVKQASDKMNAFFEEKLK
ncbi:hypothetical protein, partial [uncultured Dubosiella sp.]